MATAKNPLSKHTPPMLEHTQRTLLDLIKKTSTRNIDLQNVIFRDPGAAIAIFNLLHKKSPKAMDDVTDIQHAIGMLGLGAFESLIKNYPTMQLKRVQSKDSIYFLFSQLAHAAFYARSISKISNQASPEALATAALVQNAAILALWQKDPSAALRATKATRKGSSPEVAFHSELNGNIQEINRAVADDWGLPALARETMSSWSSFSPKPLLINLASELSRSSFANWHSDETETAIDLLEDYLPHTIKNPTAWLMQAGYSAACDLNQMDYPLAAYTRLYLPGDVDQTEEVKKKPIKEESLKDIRAQASNEAPKQKMTTVTTTSAPLDINKIIGGYMKRMRKDTGNQRIIFAMLTPDRASLKTRLALGGEKTDAIRQFSTSIKEQNIFSAMMKKQQALWITSKNLPRYAAHIPLDHKRTFSTKGFFAMSIFINTKPIGLMIADNAEELPATEKQYLLFRKYCTKIADVISNPK